MTDFRITLPCAECQGTGYLAIQTAVDVFQEHPCEVCSENGFRSHREEYPSLAEARADYPTALEMKEVAPQEQHLNLRPKRAMDGCRVMIDDLPLFSRRYPYSPGYRKTDTSRAAAADASQTASTLRSQALQHIIEAGDGGLTADEVAKEMGMSVLSIRPRVTELNKQYFIRDTGRRRVNASGKSAIVWEVGSV